MKSTLALAAASTLALSGCVTYDDGYRTTGRVGGAYGAYRGQQDYPETRTRIVEDRAGNVYRIYPDGTAILISRGGYSNYPYGYGGGYANPPYGYGGGYPSYGYPYGYGGYSGPPRVQPLPHPTPSYPTPSYPSRPAPNSSFPNGGVSSQPPIVGPVPPPVFRPRAESAGSAADRSEARRESHKGRELRGNEP